MADLSAMYMDLAENARNAPYQGMLRAQQFMENQLAYQKAKEDLEAQRGLRALFAQNPNATPEEVSRFSPQFGMEMVKAQQEAQERQGRMTKTDREISAMEAKTVAETIGPIAERAKMTGDLGTYNAEMGQALSALAQQGIPLPMNFDPKQHTPDRVLMNAVGRGYKSPLIENQMAAERERMLSRVPPRMSAEQAYGGVESSPYGYKYKPPLPQAGGAPQSQPVGNIPAPAIEFEGQTYTGPQFAKAFMAETDPARRAKMNEYIDASMASQQQGLPQAQFITPEQESALRMQEEQQKKAIETAAAGQRKGAELTAETAEETAKKAATMAVLPPDEEVYSLIKKSLAGEIEKGIKGTAASEKFGISTEANTATAELISIQEQLRGVVKALYTPGAITKDEQEKMETAIGAIASAKDPESRIAGYRRFMDMARKSIVNHPELASEVERITGNKVLSPRRKLDIGHTVGNMRYKGGNPNDKSSWEEVK